MGNHDSILLFMALETNLTWESKLELTIQPRLSSNSQESSCRSILIVGITIFGVNPHDGQ